jgi:predicted metal-binding protein
MCPPFLPTVTENRHLVKKYTFALLLQLKQSLLQPDKESMRLSFDNTARRFGQMAVSLERKAFSEGFHLAMALGAGECKLCAICTIQNNDHNCINPGAARPSMEGMGIDVVKTFTDAGLSLEFKTDELVVAGLLLID